MSRKTIFNISALLFASLLALSLVIVARTANAQDQEGETQSQAETETNQTIYEVIQAEPTLSDFEALVDAAVLDDNLKEDGPFTVFAPTNAAWAAFNTLSEEESMTDILLYHVLNGEYSSEALTDEWGIMTLAGKYLFFDATVDKAETNIVLNGTVEVTIADIAASNGVVHIVDAVVPFPEENSLFASELGSPDATIAEVLADDGRFETFLSLAEAAGLTEALENTAATYTLFAPTDEAFEQVPEEMMDDWLANPEEALNTILSYHIVGDRLSINQIANDDYLPTLEGRALVVTIDEDVRVYLNGRSVESFNILASNGVIHVVDEVILP
jgi:uncharacterized surface protein with fasciclin (FAS1) repeats